MNRLLSRLSAVRLLAPLVLVLCVAGCVSARKRYEQGVELEQKGRLVEAARRYIDALEKDPNEAGARERLEEIGQDAVDRLVEQSGRARSDGRAVASADLLVDASTLATDARAVGVVLTLPDDFEDRRAAAFREAVRELLDRGRAAEDDLEFADAIDAYERVDRYEPDGEAASAAEEGITYAMLGWAKADLEAGRPLSALKRTEAAIERLGGPDSEAATGALALREEILVRGTVAVAFTPLRTETERDRSVSRRFVDELNDLLEIQYWTHPPLLVASADPVVVRREIRRLGLDRDPLDERDAARIGRNLEAHFVLVGEVTGFSVEERDVKRRLRSASLEVGGDTTWVEVTGRLRMEAEVALRLVETRSRRVVERGTFTEREEGSFERGEYAGDPEDLRLSRNQRRLFDPDRLRDQEIEIEDGLIERLVDRIGKEGFDQLGKQLH